MTERQLEKELHTQQLKYDALINSLGEGLIVIDPDGNISQVNAYAQRVLGFTEEELIGQWFPRAIVAVDEFGNSINPLARAVTKSLTEGNAVTEYTYFLRKNGLAMPVLLTASPILIDDKPAGAIEVFRDLTKERELDLAKEDFVSLASHQLRTPATGVKAILSMLHNGNFGKITAQQKKYLELAIGSNDRQLQIIEDLLSVARADAGTMELELDYVNVAELVRNAAQEQESSIRERQQLLELDVPKGVSAVVDAQKMQMIIDNLLTNACKYTHPGGEIRVSLRQDKTKLQLEVEDTGVGIAEDQISSIFTKFGRVDNELSAPASGTGLGLYLAKKIISLHNGSINVQSSPGHGSLFSVVLPNSQPTQARQ